MSTDRLASERGRFLPNPYETFPPATEREAFEDAIRYMGTLMPRAQVREFVQAMGSNRVVEAVQGMVVKPPLNFVELYLGNTLEYCFREGLVKSPTIAVYMIEAVRQAVLKGGIFIGQERSPRQP